MKYTRNRQMGKSMKWKAWKGQKNLKMSEMTKRTKELDPTFKWHRESDYGDNWIELGGDGYRYGVLFQTKACYKTLKGLTK